MIAELPRIESSHARLRATDRPSRARLDYGAVTAFGGYLLPPAMVPAASIGLGAGRIQRPSAAAGG